ncbi:hypothetical protein GCM10028807_07040 [Spirosoma daeguense]
MKYILILLFLMTGLACSPSDDAVPANNQLVGKWQLLTYCMPSTGSSCTQITVPSDKGVFITFRNDGSFTESYENTKPVDYAFLGCGGGDYSIESNSVRIRALCMSSTYGRLMQIVSVNSTQLILNPFGTGDYLFVKK